VVSSIICCCSFYIYFSCARLDDDDDDEETRRFVNPFVLSAVSGNDRKCVPKLSLCVARKSFETREKKILESSRFQYRALFHRAVVCFSTVGLAFPRDDDER